MANPSSIWNNISHVRIIPNKWTDQISRHDSNWNRSKRMFKFHLEVICGVIAFKECEMVFIGHTAIVSTMQLTGDLLKFSNNLRDFIEIQWWQVIFNDAKLICALTFYNLNVNWILLSENFTHGPVKLFLIAVLVLLICVWYQRIQLTWNKLLRVIKTIYLRKQWAQI